MKKYLVPLLMTLFALLVAGCALENPSVAPEPVISESETAKPIGSEHIPAKWTNMNAAFTREGSSQYDNATLMMKYLDNGCAMFEFRLMEGSESEDSAIDTILPGVLIIGDNGMGIFKTVSDAENPFSVQFALSEDGQTIEVTHNGKLEIPPDGRYNFVESHIEVSDASVSEVLAFLPTAATSLNSSPGAYYTIHYPDALISDWFYSVEAVFDDSGAALAKFLIAKDLSAVFRADDDIKPVLIFGSAQPMMDASIMVQTGGSPTEDDGNAAENSVEDEPAYEPRRLVSVALEHGAYMAPGTSGKLMAVIPADLPYTLTAKSLDEGVAVVDENGVVMAVGEGEAEIQCVVTCEDGVVNISVPLCVTDTLESDTVIPEYR